MIFSLALVSISCEKDTAVEELNPEAVTQEKLGKEQLKSTVDGPEITGVIDQDVSTTYNLKNVLLNAVEPSECAPTEFDAVISEVLQPFYTDIYALSYYSLYLDLNFYMAYLDTSEQYFGADGEYTNFMTKRQRELEKFWTMPGEIRVNGQHTASLNDREKLADIYEIVGANINSREEAYEAADAILELNSLSPNLPESPYFAIDGFATSGNLIVIGDGIVEMLSATGIDSEIVWTGILAHEWAHQIQFDHYTDWYPNGAAEDPAADTRHTELEADFIAAYYMTHKRGATYNWKRVEQFFDLYFQIGDCSFASSGHHGTPNQRIEAARLGYELADSAQKKGHILSQEEVHEYFMSQVDNIL